MRGKQKTWLSPCPPSCLCFLLPIPNRVEASYWVQGSWGRTEESQFEFFTMTAMCSMCPPFVSELTSVLAGPSSAFCPVKLWIQPLCPLGTQSCRRSLFQPPSIFLSDWFHCLINVKYRTHQGRVRKRTLLTGISTACLLSSLAAANTSL